MRSPCRRGSRRQRAAGRGLIKLVQLLIRWKAFNLDNLLTTWPTHYTFPISDNPQQDKKHSPIPCRRLDTLPPFVHPPSRLPCSNSHPIVKSSEVAAHSVHHRRAFRGRGRLCQHVDTWKKLAPSEYRREIEAFGGARRGCRKEEAKGQALRCTFGAFVASWTVSPWRYLSHKQGVLFSSRWSSDTMAPGLYLYVWI